MMLVMTNVSPLFKGTSTISSSDSENKPSLLDKAKGRQQYLDGRKFQDLSIEDQLKLVNATRLRPRRTKPNTNQ